MTSLDTVEIVSIAAASGFVLLSAGFAVRLAVKRRSTAPLWTLVPCLASLFWLWLSSAAFLGSHFSGGPEPTTGLVYVLFGCGLAVLLPAWSLRNDGEGWVRVAAVPILVPIVCLASLGLVLWAFGVD